MATIKTKVIEKHYAVVKEVGANDKCPPQAKLIVDLIGKADGKVMERSAIVAALPGAGLVTKQTPERIFSFYRPKLVEMGVLEERSVEKEVDKEVPDKAPKAAKPEAADGEAKPAEGTVPPASVKNTKGTPKAA